MTESKKSKGLYWIIGILIFGFIFYLGGIYYSFYKDVKEVKDSILRHTFENGPLSHPIANNDYVATWGAFGDFIGGTLNPILTFFSICLILLTVYQNKKALDFNSEELALSRKAQQDSAKSQQLIQKTQNLQQFDSLFFSLLNQFKHQQDVLCSLNEESKSKVDKIYRSIFVEDYKAELEEKRHNLLQYQELNQYFICLFQVFYLFISIV